MTTLITGATGNVGKAVIEQWPIDRLGELRVGVRNIERARPGFSEDRRDLLQFIPFDIEKPETWTAALAGVSRVFLIRPPEITDANGIFAPLIDAMRGAGVDHIVFLSLWGAKRASFVPHRRIEKLIEPTEMTWTFLRAGFFMQNLATAHRDEIRDDGELFIPAGRGKTSFIDARDIAAVAIKALTEPGHARKVYPLTGGEALDYYEVAQIFSEELGRSIRYANPSPPRFFLTMRKKGTPLAFAFLMIMVYVPTRLGWTKAIDLTMRHLLGRAPLTIRDFARDYATVWTKEGEKS